MPASDEERPAKTFVKLPSRGDLIFFGDTLVGYVSRAEPKDDAHILTICVPFVDLPPAHIIRAVSPKHITIKVGQHENEKRSPIFVPSKRILGTDGRPIT